MTSYDLGGGDDSPGSSPSNPHTFSIEPVEEVAVVVRAFHLFQAALALACWIAVGLAFGKGGGGGGNREESGGSLTAAAMNLGMALGLTNRDEVSTGLGSRDRFCGNLGFIHHPGHQARGTRGSSAIREVATGRGEEQLAAVLSPNGYGVKLALLL